MKTDRTEAPEHLPAQENTTEGLGAEGVNSSKSSKREGPPPAPDERVEETVPRRDFLARAGHAAVGLCALSFAAGAVRFAAPAFEEGPPRKFPFGRLADFGMNTLTWLRDRDLFVLRSPAGMGAFSSRCTHLGCTLRRTAEGFVCPCHGARYDALGGIVSGPARRPLPWYPVWLERDGRLWVDLGKPLDTVGPIAIVLPAEEKG